MSVQRKFMLTLTGLVLLAMILSGSPPTSSLTLAGQQVLY